MRLILSGVFVFLGVLITVGIFGELFPKQSSPWLFALIACGTGAGLTIIALKFFNKPGTRLFGYKSIEDYIAELREQNLLESEEFTANRAFQVEEFEDEGSNYYIELIDSSVLFLSGQYLYEYEPINEKDEIELRRFPCREFTLYKHKKEGLIVGIECKGEILEPEIITKPFNEKEFKQSTVPENGQIINDKSYDEIKLIRIKES